MQYKPSSTPSNHILTALSPEENQRIAPHLEYVRLTLGTVLYESQAPIEHIYFPLDAMVSLVATLAEHNTTEFALVGHEGLVGLPVIWGGMSTPSRAIVQVPGSAMRVKAEIIKQEFDRGGMLQKRLLLYMQALFTQMAQNSASKSHHTVEQRLAAWLLLVEDSLQKNVLPLTQKYIAQLLGTRRATITVAAGQLQEKGMIRYSRGSIEIVDRPALESTAAESYSVVKQEYDRLSFTGP